MLPSHVDLADLKASVRDCLPSLSSAPSHTPEAFLEAAMGWANRWVTSLNRADISNIAPFALVFCEHKLPTEAGWNACPFFREEAPKGVGGVIAATATSFFSVQLLETKATDLRALGEALIDCGFEESPMLIVDPADSRMYYCLKGVSNERSTFSLAGQRLRNVTKSTVDASLAEFHLEHTKYPDGFSHLWHDRPSRTLRRDAEAIVRDALFLHFRHVTFSSQYIVREELLPSGRADISIHELVNGHRTACLFELKVLRSRGMTKKSGAGAKTYNDKAMLHHARMGVRQAQKYKEAAKADLAYVCLFDGRDTETAMPTISALAAERGIEFQKFFMETSTRDDLEVGAVA